jgi:hypothetical protein
VALLYADEGFPKVVTQLLRQLDHDVLMVQEAGQANQKIPDGQVLAFATNQGRAVLTLIEMTLSAYTASVQIMQALLFVLKIWIGSD